MTPRTNQLVCILTVAAFAKAVISTHDEPHVHPERADAMRGFIQFDFAGGSSAVANTTVYLSSPSHLDDFQPGTLQAISLAAHEGA